MVRFLFCFLMASSLFATGCQWLQTLPLQPQAPASPAATRPAGGRVYVTDKDSRVVAIRADQGAVAEQFPVEDGAGGVVVSPDGLNLYASAKTKDYLRIFHTTGSPEGRIATGKEPAGLAMASDGSRIYVANKGSDTVSVIDPVQRKPLKAISTGKQPQAVALSPDGKTVYVLASGDNAIVAYDAQNGKETARAAVASGTFGLAIDPQNKYVYVTSFDTNEVAVHDVASLAQIARVPVGDGAYDVVAAKSGQIYVSCVEEGAVVSFQRDAWKREPQATPVGARPCGLALSADEKEMFVALEGDARLAIVELPSLKVKAALDLGVIPVDVFCGF